jgi:TyrR family helix-turn-helix protein/PAS domain S-box-containing protein
VPNQISVADILRTFTEAVLVVDGRGRLLSGNRRAETFLQLDIQRSAGRMVGEIIPGLAESIGKCLQGGPALSQAFTGKTGPETAVDITPITSKSGLVGLLCRFTENDRTNLSVASDRSVRNPTPRADTIFQYSTDGLWLYDKKGVVINTNEAAKAYLDAPVDTLVGKHYTELIDLGLLDRSVVPEVLKTQQQVTVISYSRAGKGEHAVTGTPIFDDRGEFESIVVNVRDLTELNRLKKQLEDNIGATEKFKEELTALNLIELNKEEIVAQSESMKKILRTAAKMAAFDVGAVLILGESGTGKGLLAKFIHQARQKTENTFIQINCAALPENLLEAELFGYEKGAFTGASETGKPGLIELARGGTLFLDEIGELTPTAQAKLLTYLDDRTVIRVGGTKSQKVDCTIIAATNRNLEDRVTRQQFREDLYFRLSAFNIRIPPLRERVEDILSLIGFFLHHYNQEFGQRRYLSPMGLEKLVSYHYPGNVREMKNMVKAAVVLSEQNSLDDFLAGSLGALAPSPLQVGNGGLDETLRVYERQILERALHTHKTTRKMAESLQMSQSAVVRRLRKHGLNYGR